MSEITLGAGCFWCIEACFKEVNGIISVKSGYSNGHHPNPTYKEVCTGTTGHNEVARIVYDESVISLNEILKIFFFVHDPTQLNRQGNDIGTQYRSAIYYHTADQKEFAENLIAELTKNQVWEKPIVTEVLPIENYHEAEDYHQDYLEFNPENAYCKAIVRPKVDKFKAVFADFLK
jgi:methionine-S-sulfoxide reductase